MMEKEILKEAKLRVTPVRLDVLKYVKRAGVAVSNQDLESDFAEVDRVTLYRTLKTFEEKGILHKVVDGTGQNKFALCESDCDEHSHHDEHIHFHCMRCENTFCLDEVNIPSFSLPIGYLMESREITVNGICRSCSAS